MPSPLSPLPALPVTPPQGLTAATAQRRGREEGANTLALSQRRPWRTLAWQRLVTQHLAASDPLPPSWPLAREDELSPASLAMSQLWRDPSAEQDRVARKGATEAVVALCHLPAAQAQRVQQAAALAGAACGGWGGAQARHPKGPDWPAQQHDFDFEWLRLVGLADPLRPEVPAAVARCHRTGIRVVMITGDGVKDALTLKAAHIAMARGPPGAR